MSFGIRTPTNKGTEKAKQGAQAKETSNASKPTQNKENPNKTFQVRKSIGEWEANLCDPLTANTSKTSEKKIEPATGATHDNPPKTTEKVLEGKASGEKTNPPSGPTRDNPIKYADKVSEGRASLVRAKFFLGLSRNLRGDIKEEVLFTLERLYHLLKESEGWKGKGSVKNTNKGIEREKEEDKNKEHKDRAEEENFENLKETIKEHTLLLKENNKKMEELKECIGKQQEFIEKRSYATVLTSNITPPTKRNIQHTALHSVIVTSKDETETSEQVLDRIRKAVNAKDGEITVDRIRKAKDRKIIVGCRTDAEREKIKEKLKAVKETLNCEEVQNKHPLVILKDVMTYNNDDDVLGALRNQNQHLFKDIKEEDTKAEIAYKRRTRNPHTHHIIMRVSPKLWQRLMEVETVHIDLQRIRVADQTPLIQCSLCLGYGHGRRFCTETLEKCSHCGGPHKRADCADFMAGELPSCCNCVKAKIDKTDHNAFNQECPIKKKWDALARSTVAYC